MTVSDCLLLSISTLSFLLIRGNFTLDFNLHSWDKRNFFIKTGLQLIQFPFLTGLTVHSVSTGIIPGPEEEVQTY